MPLNLENCWEIYNSFRLNIKKTNGFGIFLEISEDLPNDINRWFGENIKAIGLSTNVFVSNDKGLPILLKSHQLLVEKMFYFKAYFIIMGEHFEDLSKYRNYLCYLFKKQPKVNKLKLFL